MKSLNVAYNIVGKYYISTGMWATAISATGMCHPTYETFIWQYNRDNNTMGKLIKQYYHNDRKDAIAFHFRLSKTLTYRYFKKLMPSDSPYVEKQEAPYFYEP